jgi:glycosyltransferase involved in cell wall biosynthesis
MLIAVIPAYNEESTVADVVRKVRKHASRVIVVDDSSSDSTSEKAKAAGALVVSHKQNMGLGSSLRTGFAKALELAKNDDDIVVCLDADGQHNPDDIPKLVKKVEEGYDFVLGKRDLSKYPLSKKIGGWGLTFGVRLLGGPALSDTESGFRAFRASALRKMRLVAKRYEIAMDIAHEAARLRLKSCNVEIASPRYVKGVNVMDGFRNAWFYFRRRVGLAWS